MKKIVIVGGGYGGLYAIESLKKYENIEILLIDKNPYHYLQTEAYGYIAGRFDIHDIAIDLKDWTKGFSQKVSFLNKEVMDINFKNNTLILKNEEILYDYIIVATGAKTNFFSFIDGLRENSHGVKNLERAHNFRIDFENLIYSKLQQNEDIDNKIHNIAIGGAGLSGVEIAAEMAYVLNKYGKAIGSNTKEINIYLIDASKTILPGMSNYIINNTHKRLEDLGVKILSNAFIGKVDSEYIYFKDGNKLYYSFMIFTGGITANDINSKLSTTNNKLNQLILDDMLNIQGYKNAFGVGDCVEIRDINKNILPPTAQIAEKSAKYAVDSIIRDINIQKQEKFDAKVSGVFIALGGSYAVGEIFKYIKIKGYAAYIVKKIITYTYYLGLRFRINVGFRNRNK